MYRVILAQTPVRVPLHVPVRAGRALQGAQAALAEVHRQPRKRCENRFSPATRSAPTISVPELLLQLLKTPTLTGAFTPSSRHLASAMVRAIGDVPHVVELGAGTGPVTKELRSRLPHASLVAVELQPGLAHKLRMRFAGLDVRQSLAHEVLDALDYAEPAAVVSSLPFRSLPQDMRDATTASIERFLRRVPGSRLVQFTYQPRVPFAASADFQWHKTCSVWRNAPPAGVWVLESLPAT